MKLKAFLLLFIMISCGVKEKESEKIQFKDIVNKPNNQNSVNKRDSSKHGVLIMDTGFDINNEVFKNKIIGLYSLECNDEESDFEYFLDNLNKKSLSEIEKDLVKRQSKDLENCQFQEGLKFSKSKKIEDIIQYKDELNEFFRQKGQTYNYSLLEEIEKEISFILSGENNKYEYHGTTVSSLIAYKNSNVQLVFVQKKLESNSSFARKVDVNDKQDMKVCHLFDNIDKFVEILESPDYQKAYIEKKLTSLESNLSKVIKKHQINFLNYSFNGLPRLELEKMLKEEIGCKYIPNFKNWYRVENQLKKKRLNFLKKVYPKSFFQNDVLTFQAAGNEGVEINSIEDGKDCTDADNNHFLVGSINYLGMNSKFSNNGDCVAIKMIGEDLLSFTVEDFIFPVNGTSFSTPLVIRYLTKKFSRETKLNSIKKELFSSLDYQKNLGKGFYPHELVINYTSLKIPTNVVARISKIRENPFKFFSKKKLENF